MKRNQKTTVMAVLLVSGAIVLGGCGGGGSGKRLSKAEFATKVSALCTDYRKKIKPLGNSQSSAEAAKLMKRNENLLAQLVAEMKKLKPPANEEASVDRILTIAQQERGIIEQVIVAVERNDRAEYSKLFNKLIRSGGAMDEESNRIFRQLGATACAK
ncbi:MAG: hypothetical protein ABSB96_03115 [Gaiellaceae bacterium]